MKSAALLPVVLLATLIAQATLAASNFGSKDQIFADAICQLSAEFQGDQASLNEHSYFCQETQAEELTSTSAEDFCALFETARSRSDCYSAYLTALAEAIKASTALLEVTIQAGAQSLLRESELYADKVCGFQSETTQTRQMWNETQLITADRLCRLPIYQNLLTVLVSVLDEE